jgi:hypothetical protein
LCRSFDPVEFRVPATALQVYDTGECCTGRLYYSVMILRMYAIDSITIHSVDDDNDTEPKRWAMVFGAMSDEHETNHVSPASTRFQPDIQSLTSSALLFPTPPWHRRYRSPWLGSLHGLRGARGRQLLRYFSDPPPVDETWDPGPASPIQQIRLR